MEEHVFTPPVVVSHPASRNRRLESLARLGKAYPPGLQTRQTLTLPIVNLLRRRGNGSERTVGTYAYLH